MEIIPYSFNYNERFVTLAVEGMGFYKLGDSRLASTYARYILYTHLLFATDAYMVKDQDKVIGMLLYRDKKKSPLFGNDPSLIKAKMKNRRLLQRFSPKSYLTLGDKIDTLIHLYFSTSEEDGELLFLVSDIHYPTRGIGKALLNKLSEDHKNERVVLLTDSNCNVGFYDHMGFELVKKISVSEDYPSYYCYFYAKTL